MRVDEARAVKRRRIAGEMHDVLAHRTSMVNLHAGALEFQRDAWRWDRKDLSAADLDRCAEVSTRRP